MVEINHSLVVGAGLAMASQVPARHVAGVGQKRVHASLDLRRIENELRLTVFLRDGVIAVDRNLAEGLPVCSYAVAEDSVIDGVNQRRQAQHGRQPDQQQPLQKVFDPSSQR